MARKTAEERIREVRETGATELDLSGANLPELPAEIGQLTQLRRLDLSKNSLADLPVVIGRLTRLQAPGALPWQ